MYKSKQKRYMYDWVPLLSTWNYHNSVNWLYGNKKQKKVNKNKSTQKSLKNSRGIISQQHSWCVLFYLSPTHFLLLNYLQVPTYYFILKYFSSVQFSSVTQSCPTLCDLMNRSTPGLPVHHELPESTQTHVHRVSDAIQPSHPLSSPSPPAPNPSQHQGLFQWINSSHEVAKVLEFQLQHQSFQWTPRTDLL